MTRTVLFSLVSLATAGCIVGHVGNGDAATEIRAAEGAVAFENALFMRSTVVVDDSGPAIEVTCDDNLLDEIITEVDEGGVLVLRSRVGANLVPRARCEAFVRLPEVRSLAGSGSGATVLVDDVDGLLEIVGTGSGAVRVEAQVSGVEHIGSHGSGAVEIESLRGCSTDIAHTGSGRVVVDDLRVCDIEIDSSGSGRTVLSGLAELADISLSGSGGFGDQGFAAQEAILRSSGSGGIELTVTERVEVDLSGSGGATVHGDPPQRDVSESGSGRARFE
jgi:hypothetical protein